MNTRTGRRWYSPGSVGDLTDVVLSLELRHLEPFDQLAWIHLAVQAAECIGGRLHLVIGKQGLDDGVRRALGALPPGFTYRFEHEALLPGADEEFVFLSGAEAFSTKLLTGFRCVHVEPVVAPTGLSPCLYWHAIANERFVTELAAMAAHLEQASAESRVAAYYDSLRLSARRVSLLTSIFNGDRYLDGFLTNATALRGYEECEHFLVRAGSRGNEHRALLTHVGRWPGSVYINLPVDPGLYEVWNLAARLSTAPYLSSANLDDRRAPEHVTDLADVLDANPQVDVASAALRVTETPNLTWEASADCPVWFGTGPESPYSARELIQPTAQGHRSRNLPHCMPLWRRSLHAFNGYFRETEFGPSADWEFWLRAGLAGARFARLDKPLGLYLKHPESYWRRAPDVSGFDSRIAERYVPPLLDGKPDQRPRLPWGLRFAELRSLAGTGAYLEFAARLIACARDLHDRSESGSANELVDAFARRHLGIPSLMAWVRDDSRGVLRRAHSLDGLFECLVEVLHRRLPALDETGHSGSSARVLWGAFVDLFGLTRDVRALLGCALLLGAHGQAEAERRLWRAAHRLGEQAFWRGFQDVYRFGYPLETVTRSVSNSIITCVDVDGPEPGTLNLWFYPDFSGGNAYQALLYEGVVEVGGWVEGVQNQEDIAGLEPVAGRTNVLHLHWIHAVFAGAGVDYPGEMERRVDAFLETLHTLQRRGIRVYWTVHNYLSHEAVSKDTELRLRRALYELADRVYVHHPMIPGQLDWLPAHPRVHLVEHGAYPSVRTAVPDVDAARRELGFDKDDLVLACTGNIRAYKGLEKYLPVLRDVMAENTRLKLIVAGKLAAPEVRRKLSGLPREQVLIKKGFLPAEELAACLHAADYAFLTYRSILTSGSLFQAFSEGTPVIAPALGTIPAYVVNGWNGYTYTSGGALRRLLRLRLGDTWQRRRALRDNAHSTAESLRWRFF